jgi:hypothetical protein
MVVRGWQIILCAVSALAMTTAAEAAKKTTRGKTEPPIMRGCTIAVPPLCTGMVAGGRTYALMGAVPAIPTGIGVDVYGTVSGVSLCVAVPVQVTSWKRNRMKCPAG